MRTTVTLADDVAVEVARLRRELGMGLSDAVNELVRRGMSSRPAGSPYVHRATHLGLRVDVSDVAEVLDLLDDDRPT